MLLLVPVSGNVKNCTIGVSLMVGISTQHKLNSKGLSIFSFQAMIITQSINPPSLSNQQPRASTLPSTGWDGGSVIAILWPIWKTILPCTSSMQKSAIASFDFVY
jgi:hypothetical protein